MNPIEHLLICLVEECAEVQKAVSKSLRFGLSSSHTGSEMTNGEEISHELNDLIAVADMLVTAGAIPSHDDQEKSQEKTTKVHRFMETAVDLGTLTRDTEPEDDLSIKLKIGGRYNWRNQEERLVYMGNNFSGNGYWHQFSLVDHPGKVWCEVKEDSLQYFDEADPT